MAANQQVSVPTCHTDGRDFVIKMSIGDQNRPEWKGITDQAAKFMACSAEHFDNSDATPQLTSFTLFLKLPPEIQNEIWKMAFHPYVFMVVMLATHTTPDMRVARCRTWSDIPLYRVGQYPRALAVEKYGIPTPHVVPFSPQLDGTLELYGAAWLEVQSSGAMGWRISVLNWPLTPNIRSISIHMSLWCDLTSTSGAAYIGWWLKDFPNFEELVFLMSQFDSCSYTRIHQQPYNSNDQVLLDTRHNLLLEWMGDDADYLGLSHLPNLKSIRIRKVERACSVELSPMVKAVFGKDIKRIPSSFGPESN